MENMSVTLEEMKNYVNEIMEEQLEKAVLAYLKERGFCQNQISLQEEHQRIFQANCFFFNGNNQRKKHANVSSVVKSNSNEKRVAIKDTRKTHKSIFGECCNNTSSRGLILQSLNRHNSKFLITVYIFLLLPMQMELNWNREIRGLLKNC